MIWAYLVHLGFNMWREAEGPIRAEYTNASPVMRFDRQMWNELLEFMVKSGMNTVVIDLGEGVKYESHPEIGAEDAWSVGELRKELARIRCMGLTPIPKLNFSASHDEWLGDYSRCVSSKIYYDVCKDLINEVVDIFDKPPLFHLGMDEEKESHSQYWGYGVIRHGDFWWKDLYFFIDTLERQGVRPWVWSDYVWVRQNEFLNKMPKSVMQSNWYYNEFFDKKELDTYVAAYNVLDRNGYDQIPCGMMTNIIRTVKYCKDVLAPEKLKGFMQTSWKPTLLARKYIHLAAVDLTRQAREGFEGNEAMFAGWKGPWERPGGYDIKDTIGTMGV